MWGGCRIPGARRRVAVRDGIEGGKWGVAATTAILIVAAGCSSDGPTAPSATDGRSGSVARLAVTGGDGQAGPVASPLPLSPSVRVVSAGGTPQVGVVVRFSVISGGGSVASPEVSTDAEGVASAGAWTLGPEAGAQELRAAVAGLPAVTFRATAEPASPAGTSVMAGDGQTAVAGTAVDVPPAVAVRDSFANPIPGVPVVFSIEQGGGSLEGAQAVTDDSGVARVSSWTLGATAGPNRVVASVDELPPVAFRATGLAGAPVAVAASAGEGQSATAGSPVSVPPAVRVVDAHGNGIAGVEVTFAVTAGGGSLSGSTVDTDAGGVATLGGWTLGPSPGANTLVATVDGSGVAGNPVTFTATGTTGGAPGAYDLEIRYNAGSDPTGSQRAAFDAAAARWEELIMADLPDVAVDRPAGTCTSTSPISETVDDLVIFVTLKTIDGPGGIVGSAGPCLIRSGSDLPLAGSMELDVADLASLESSGLLDDVILHEIGHVLGIGTLWNLFGVLADPASSGGTDPHFTGPQGRASFDSSGGSGYSGAKVPVENTGGSGTIDGHWRESVLDDELMTGWIDPSSNPLSEISVSSLGDLGYAVNPGAADAFALSFSVVARPGSRPGALRLTGDTPNRPIEVVDRQGRRVGIVRH